MNKKVFSFLKKQWILVWCIIVATALFSLIVSAEYELTTTSMKKVVASTSDQGKMFSSNILVENGGSSYYPIYQQEVIDVDILLWNHSLNDIYKYYPSAIDYKITLTFTDTHGEPLLSIPSGKYVELYKGNDSSPLLTLNSTSSVTSAVQSIGNNLSQSAEDHYKLKFCGGWDLENDTNICVKMEAVPFNNGVATRYQDLAAISSVIGLKKTINLGSSGWEAYIYEQMITGKTISDFDAFNLIATGSGKAIITLKWDIRKIECNNSFYSGKIYTFGTYVNSDNSQVQELVYTAPLVGSYTVTRSGEPGNYSYSYSRSDGAVFPTSGQYTWQLNNGAAGTYEDFQTDLANADFSEAVTVTVGSDSIANNTATLVLTGDTNTPLYLNPDPLYFEKRGIYVITRSGSPGNYTYSYTKNESAAVLPITGEYTWQLNNGEPGSYADFLTALESETFEGDDDVTVTVAASTDTLDNRNRYDLQFYKKGTDPSDWTFHSVTYSETPSLPTDDVWLTVNVNKQ